MRLRGWVSSHSISFWHINKPKSSVSPKFSKQEIPKRAAIWRFSGASVWVVYKQEPILVRDTADWRGLQQDQQGETPGWTNVKTSCESTVKVKQSVLSPTPSSPGTACFFLQMKLLPLPLIGQTLTAVMTVRQMAPPPMTSLVSCPLSPHRHRGNRKVSNCIWPSVMWLSLTSSVMSPVMSCLCFSGVGSSSSTSPPPVCTPPSSSMKSPPPPPASRSSTSNRHHHHHHHQSTKQKRLSSTKSQASSKTDATHIKEVAGDGETISFIVLSLWYVSDNHFFKRL